MENNPQLGLAAGSAQPSPPPRLLCHSSMSLEHLTAQHGIVQGGQPDLQGQVSELPPRVPWEGSDGREEPREHLGMLSLWGDALNCTPRASVSLAVKIAALMW